MPRFGLAVACRDATSVTEVVFAADSAEARDQWRRAILRAATTAASRRSFAEIPK